MNTAKLIKLFLMIIWLIIDLSNDKMFYQPYIIIIVKGIHYYKFKKKVHFSSIFMEDNNTFET
jgi:hypothetical protein